MHREDGRLSSFSVPDHMQATLADQAESLLAAEIVVHDPAAFFLALVIVDDHVSAGNEPPRQTLEEGVERVIPGAAHVHKSDRPLAGQLPARVQVDLNEWPAAAFGFGDHSRPAARSAADLDEIAAQALGFKVHHGLRELAERGLVEGGEPFRRDPLDDTEHLRLPDGKPADQESARHLRETAYNLVPPF